MPAPFTPNIIDAVLVDFHTHVFPAWLRERRDEYIKYDPCFSLLYSRPEARMATAQELLASMDEAGIDVSIMLNIGWASQDICVETNDYILESASRYPTRLVGFCAVQPAAGDAAVTELERCAAAGAKGIGELRPDAQGFDLTDSTIMKPLVDAALQHDLIFLTHSSEPVGHDYEGKGSITPDVLYRFVLAFPDLKLVCAHWGGGLPFYALMPEVDKALANVFFDTAATVYLYKPGIFEHVSRIIGSNKILFGTDYPLMRQNRVIAQIESTCLADEDRTAILGANALKLLGRAGGANGAV